MHSNTLTGAVLRRRDVGIWFNRITPQMSSSACPTGHRFRRLPTF